MRARYLWAVVLIVVGVWFLLDNLGVLGHRAWSIFWPIALIVVGLGLLLSRYRPARFVAMGDHLALEGATVAKITFRHGAGRLNVTAGAGTGLLYSGSFGGGIERKVRRVGDALDVVLQPSQQDWARWIVPWSWFGARAGMDWDVRLGSGVLLELVFETGASESHLDLLELNVGRFHVKTGASSTDIIVPAHAGHIQGRISAGAASVKITVPPSVAARVSGVMGLGAITVDQVRFPRREDYFQSSGFSEATDRLELDIDGGVGSVTVH
jgi:hypothetical protein